MVYNALKEYIKQHKLYHYKKYDRGEIVFLQNQEPQKFFLVTNGLVKLERYLPEGKVNLLRLCQQDNFFGEEFFLENSRYLTTAITKIATEVWFLNKKMIRPLIKHDQQFLYLINQFLAKLNQYNIKKMDLLYTPSLSERIKLAKQFFSAINQKNKITHEEISRLLNTTRETITRNMKAN